MASEREDTLIRKRMEYDEGPLKIFFKKTLDYTSTFNNIDYKTAEEKISYLLSEADYIENLSCQLETTQLAEDLDMQRNSGLIQELEGKIIEVREVIERKEKEYKDVLKVKACKEKYEEIAADINSYPPVAEIDSRVNY